MIDCILRAIASFAPESMILVCQTFRFNSRTVAAGHNMFSAVTFQVVVQETHKNTFIWQSVFFLFFFTVNILWKCEALSYSQLSFRNQKIRRELVQKSLFKATQTNY